MVLLTTAGKTTGASGERQDAPVGVRDKSSSRSVSSSGRASVRSGSSLPRWLDPALGRRGLGWWLWALGSWLFQAQSRKPGAKSLRFACTPGASRLLRLQCLDVSSLTAQRVQASADQLLLMDAATRSDRLRFGSFELHVRSRELQSGATCVRLQEQPFEILLMMLQRPGDVITRDELRERLWPQGTFVDFEHSLHGAVQRLRSALR